MEVEGKTSF